MGMITDAARAALAAMLLSVGPAQPCVAADREPAAPATAQAPAPAAPANDLPRRAVLRFVTESDFPPFNYVDSEGVLTGFNVDLARAICLEVSAACDIKVRPWDEHYGALTAGEADGAIAAQRITWEGVAKVEFSERYFHTPGHFAGKRDGTVLDMTPEQLERRTVAVARGTAHEAFLKRFFQDCAVKTYDSIDAAREAIADGKVEFIFDDAIGLSLWLNGTNSRQCCELKGGPFLEPRFFGDGIAIALPRSDPQLKILMDGALKRVRDSGRFEELIQRYFPNRIY
jgi:polar amino acid transport system substrate-binding protein